MAAALSTARNLSSRWLLEGPECNPTQASGVQRAFSVAIIPAPGGIVPGIMAEGSQFQLGRQAMGSGEVVKEESTTVSWDAPPYSNGNEVVHWGPVTFQPYALDSTVLPRRLMILHDALFVCCPLAASFASLSFGIVDPCYPDTHPPNAGTAFGSITDDHDTCNY